MRTRINQRVGSVAVRAGAIGLAAMALGSMFAPQANAAEPTDARDLDWKNATLELITSDGNCPGGPLKFTDGYGQTDLGNGETAPHYQGDVKFGDVNRDGKTDAVLSVTCWAYGQPAATLYAFGVQNGAPTRIGTVTTPVVKLDSYSVSGSTVTAKAQPHRYQESDPLTFKLRWNGTEFTERTGKGAYLYNWGRESFALPFKSDSVPLGGSARPCPRATIDFTDHDTFNRRGEFVSADNFVYDIQAAHFGDINRDGITDVLVALTCSDGSNWSSSGQWNYAYTVKNGKPVRLSYLTTGAGKDGYTGIGEVQVSRGKVALVQHPGTSDISVERTFRWTANGLKADKPLPGYPNVDVAP